MPGKKAFNLYRKFTAIICITNIFLKCYKITRNTTAIPIRKQKKTTEKGILCNTYYYALKKHRKRKWGTKSAAHIYIVHESHFSSWISDCWSNMRFRKKKV